MKGFQLGLVRMNLEHVLWYMPTGDPQGTGAPDRPGIAFMLRGAANPMTLQFATFEQRDELLTRLDADSVAIPRIWRQLLPEAEWDS